jgi:aryl sulfotransferase
MPSKASTPRKNPMPSQRPDNQRPEKTQIYKGLFTDSDRWADFEHRPGDIFVCTPPKCGTTWMQAICALLVFQTPDLKVNPAVISPWIDAIFTPIEEILAMLEAQTHRRIIKTHTPLDGIPYFQDCEYVCVYRDPRDVFFSLRSHIDNMKLGIPDRESDETPQEGFRSWLESDYLPGEEQGPALASTTHHLKTFRAFEHLPNVELFHYSDLIRDLPAEMKRVAAHLKIEVDAQLLPRLAEAASFANMKQNAEDFAPGADRDVWHDTARFFNKGTSGQWRDVVSDEDERAFHERLGKLLPPDAANWLVGGSGEGAVRTGSDE